MTDVLTKLGGSEAGKAHRRLHNVWLHDVADRLFLRRRTLAADAGIDPEVVERYPGGGPVTVVQAERPRGAGLAAPLLAGLAGAGITLGGMSLMDRPASEPATPPPAQEYRVTFTAEDGTPIDVDSAKPD